MRGYSPEFILTAAGSNGAVNKQIWWLIPGKETRGCECNDANS